MINNIVYTLWFTKKYVLQCISWEAFQYIWGKYFSSVKYFSFMLVKEIRQIPDTANWHLNLEYKLYWHSPVQLMWSCTFVLRQCFRKLKVGKDHKISKSSINSSFRFFQMKIVLNVLLAIQTAKSLRSLTFNHRCWRHWHGYSWIWIFMYAKLRLKQFWM